MIDVLRPGVSQPVMFNYDGRAVRVKVYSRNVGEQKNYPVSKYSDLINRAIAYKQTNPGTDVHIKFAIYKIAMEAFVGFDSTHSSYGYVKGYDHGGPHSESLAYSIVKAAKNEVTIDFVYHKDASADVHAYITSFLGTPTLSNPSKTVGDYLNIEKVSWGLDAYQQMHAKFMTVSHYVADDSSLVADTVFASTGNVDVHDTEGIPAGKDWVQSGVLINGHPDLRASFDRYFAIIFDNAHDHSAFRNAVRQQHAVDGLNYDDQHFSSFFYPIPLAPEGHYENVPETGDGDPTNGNAWDTEHNAVAKYIDRMASVSGDRSFKANVYHLKTDNFGQKLHSELVKIHDDHGSDLRHFCWVVRVNSYDHVLATKEFDALGVVRYPRDTHAKDYLFALRGVGEFYTITGSTNLKLDAHVSKANASIVIKEFTTAHQVYDEYEAVLHYLDQD